MRGEADDGTGVRWDRLDWRPRDEYRVLNRLPALVANLRSRRRQWQAQNIRRNEGNYQCEP